MRLVKLVLVLAIAVVPVFAQKTGNSTQPRKNEADVTVSRALKFEKMDVIGYIGTPNMVHIDGIADLDSDQISLTRSFKDALKVNVDQETIMRLAK